MVRVGKLAKSRVRQAWRWQGPTQAQVFDSVNPNRKRPLADKARRGFTAPSVGPLVGKLAKGERKEFKMVKQTKRTRQPNPQPEAPTTSVVAQGEAGGTPATRVPANATAMKPRTNVETLPVSNFRAMKDALLSTVSDNLTAAKTSYDLGDEADTAGNEAADNAALGLYQGLVQGLLQQDEVSAILGGVWGFAGKGDSKGQTVPAGHPDAGATPAGQGAAIRKRVVRLHSAHNFVEFGGGGAFFAPVADTDDGKDEVATLVEAVEKGDVSLFTAYDKIGKIRSEAIDRPQMAFDTSKIAKIRDEISKETALPQLADPALIAAYDALVELWGEIRGDVEALLPGDQPEAAAA